MDSVISLKGVTKRFGHHTAVDDVTIEVPKGHCYAWLGPNGCGKTTLIRMMLGLARVSSGSISVRGLPVPGRTREALSRVGGIVEEPRFYPYLSGRKNLEVWAAHQDRSAYEAIDRELDRVGLRDRANDKVKTYSLGMRQRLGVARALLNDPELLVLDEPTNGLDPAGLAEFRDMVRGLVAEGRTVFVSSHILSEVEQMADQIAIIEKGKVLANGPIGDLLRGGRQAVGVRIDDPARAEALLGGLPFGREVRRTGDDAFELLVDQVDDDALRATGRALFEAGVGVLELHPVKQTLETRFLELTGQHAGELGVDGSAGVDAAPAAPAPPPAQGAAVRAQTPKEGR